MIIDINKHVSSSGLKGVLEYHENKIQKGTGTVFENYVDFSSQHNVPNLVRSFEDFMKVTSPKSYKQRYHHISVNFNTKDAISEKNKIAILYLWMKHMSYDQTKHIIYRHCDKSHDHFHIVSSSTLISGKKIDSYLDHVRSANLSRKIERTFGLQVLGTVGEGQSYDRFEKYRYATALALLNKDELSLRAFDPIRSENFKNLSNDQIENRYRKANASQLFKQEALPFLLNKGYLKPSLKNRIYKAVTQSIDKVRSLDGLITELQRYGIYARKILKKGKSVIHFGDPELGIYVMGEKVNRKFSINELEAVISLNSQSKVVGKQTKSRDDFEMTM